MRMCVCICARAFVLVNALNRKGRGQKADAAGVCG